MSPQPERQSNRGGASPHPSMFLRMLVRAAVLRRGRATSALLGVTVAAAAVTAMLNLYVDVQAKLGKEFRSYGANVVAAGKEGQPLPSDVLQTVNTTLAGHGLAVPFAYVVAHTTSGHPVVVAGTDFDEVRKLDSWWSVTAWPRADREALVGTRAAAVVSPPGRSFDLIFQGRSIHLSQAGTVQTGGAEDSRVYLSRTDFETWTGVQPAILEIAVSGSADEITNMIAKLRAAMPVAEVRPVRQIVEGETRVLGKMRSTLLMTAVLIVITASLSVLSTLMGWVFDRRRDFAIMKALGASGTMLHGFFAAEAAALGSVGAGLGFVIGVGVAAWIGRVNFHAPVVPRLSVLPLVLGGGIGLALLAAILPMWLVGHVQPANILRGE